MSESGSEISKKEAYAKWPITRDKSRFNRRTFLKFAGGAAGAGALAIATKKYSDWDDARYLQLANEIHNLPQSMPEDFQRHTTESTNNSSDEQKQDQASEKPKDVEVDKPSSARLFEDDETQKIADELKLSPHDFFDGKRLTANFDAFESEELLPVFLPQVMRRKDKLYEWSKKYDVPVNVIATMMNIESGGINRLTSGAGAVGLFQVMPELHMQGLTPEEQIDPDKNAEAALTFFKDLLYIGGLHLESQYPDKDYKDSHPEIFIQALAMYNAGASGGAHEFNDLPFETQGYVLQARGLFKTMEIAERLRQLGKTNDEIVTLLRSQSMDARGKIFESVRTCLDEPDESRRVVNPFSDDSPNVINNELIDFVGQDEFAPTDNPKEQKLIDVFNEYLEGMSDQYTVPLGPSLRIWTQISPSFVLGDEVNKNPENYFGIDTRKTTA